MEEFLSSPLFGPPLGVTFLDVGAVVFLFSAWYGFAWLVESSPWSEQSLSAFANMYRRRWMQRMGEREQRVFDSSLVSNLMHSVSILASATIIILGGVLALLGSADRLFDALMSVPFITQVSKEFLEIKLMLMAMIFLNSFFKFTWSLRQFNYCCIVMGATPNFDARAEEIRGTTGYAARLSQLGARSFNQGLRGYYFSMAAIAWFVHPGAMIAVALWVWLVLWRREFHSRTRRALRDGTLPH